VIDDNDPITLKSASNHTVTVTQNGTNFTIVTPEGTTNKVSGDSFVYDKLNLQFGSLIVNLTLISPIDMKLTALDSVFVLSEQATLPDLSYTLDVSAEITLTNQMSAIDLSGVFFFKTDDLDIPQEYFLDKTKFANAYNVLNPMNGIVTSGYYGSNTNDHLAKDFLRDMAKQLFNTHFAVDLFTNESVVVGDIDWKCGLVAENVTFKMDDVDITNTSLRGPDVSYGYYTTEDDTDVTNITRELVDQLLTLSPGRFSNSVQNRLNPNIPKVYGIPLIAGDTISYKLSVSSHASQNTTIATGKPALETRTYKVKLVVS